MKEEIKKILILGSTGSIGEQALDVAEKSEVKVIGICANKNYKRVAEQARRFKVRYAAMNDERSAELLRDELSDTDVTVFSGTDGICEMIKKSDADAVVNSIIGQAGLVPTVTVLECGMRLALANKESLVVAGEIVMKLAKENGIEIFPVDSEHCAIHQCLRAGKSAEVKKLILTASGGPFFGKKREEISNVSKEKALAHPTWSMGAKITIDSATLMNKGFEVIEAAHLFSVGADKIDVLIHRESIIHSMVEYIDNSVIAQLSVPDMRLCIQYALNMSERREAVIEELDLARASALTFAKPDRETFPLLDYAISALSYGGGCTAVLNAANEVAVEAFLEDKISFGKISDSVCRVVSDLKKAAGIHTLDGILECDATAREMCRSYLKI